MKISLYDPFPFQNEYVSIMFFRPLEQYAKSIGIDFRRVDKLTPEVGHSMVCNADYLSSEKIIWFKENECPLIAFSCIDSAYLSESIRAIPEMELISTIFMVSGVQNVNFSNATLIDSDFNITTQKKKYLPDDEWERFDRMRIDGRLLSLPYVPWDRYILPDILPFDSRRPTILFRGGNHFLRVLAYFFAVRNSIADPDSGFQASYYFDDDMNPQFRYCDLCRSTRKQLGNYPYVPNTGRIEECTSIAPWGHELDLNISGRWNNRCPASFYWLAEQFSKKHGLMDMNQIEKAFNYAPQPQPEHLSNVGKSRFYADSKWDFSINMAQRFWEAAGTRTINLIPERANDQDYFPKMTDGENYLTFKDDFSDMSADISKEKFDYITENTRAHYNKWIHPTDFSVSTNMLDHILNQIIKNK